MQGRAAVDIVDLGETARVRHVWGHLGRRASARCPQENLHTPECASEGSGQCQVSELSSIKQMAANGLSPSYSAVTHTALPGIFMAFY